MFSKARDPDQAGGEKVQTGSCRQRWYESYSCVPQFGDELWLLTEQARGSEAAFHGLLPEDDDLQSTRFRKNPHESDQKGGKVSTTTRGQEEVKEILKLELDSYFSAVPDISIFLQLLTADGLEH